MSKKRDATVFERAHRLRLRKLKRTLQQMKRKSEKDHNLFLKPAADAFEAYGKALDTLHTSHEAMLTMMQTALHQAEESGRSRRALRTTASAIKRARQSFKGSVSALHEVMNLQWDALKALLEAYDDRPGA